MSSHNSNDQLASALVALVKEVWYWEGNAHELHERLHDFIEDVPTMGELERRLGEMSPELYRLGVDLWRIDSPNHRKWAFQAVHDPWSEF